MGGKAVSLSLDRSILNLRHYQAELTLMRDLGTWGMLHSDIGGCGIPVLNIIGKLNFVSLIVSFHCWD